MNEAFYWLENEGQRIASMLHVPPGSEPHPGILVLHGFSNDRMEHHFLLVKAARALAQAGFTVLRFDFRGSGESEGRFQDVTIPGEISDALTVFRWFAERPEVDPERLGVLGLSMGGCVGAHLAGADSRVKALALWAAVADPLGLMDELAQDRPLPPPLGWRSDGTLDIGGLLVGPDFLRTLPEVDPIAALHSYWGPALIVHGTEDPTVPTRHAEMYARALGERAQLVWVKGADHTFNAHVWEQFVIATTRDWFVEHLRL